MTDNTARGLKGRFVGNKKRRIRGKNGQFCKTDQVSDTAKHDQHEEEPVDRTMSIFPIDGCRIIDLGYFLEQLKCIYCKSELLLSLGNVTSEINKGTYIYYNCFHFK